MNSFVAWMKDYLQRMGGVYPGPKESYLAGLRRGAEIMKAHANDSRTPTDGQVALDIVVAEVEREAQRIETGEG